MERGFNDRSSSPARAARGETMGSLDSTYEAQDSYVSAAAAEAADAATLSEEQKDQIDQTAQEFCLTQDEAVGDGEGERVLLRPKKTDDGVPAGPPRAAIILPALPPLHFQVAKPAAAAAAADVNGGGSPGGSPPRPSTTTTTTTTFTTNGIPPPPAYEGLPPRRLPSRSVNPMKLPPPGPVRVESIAMVPSLCLSSPLHEDEAGVLSIPCDACHENMVVPKEAILASCHQCHRIQPASLTASYQ
eukprot:scaffold102958_cov58-Attheya_sp.AAC.3